tara:strand:+ start:1108 stop:1410 length:303 start_codon:yes stop_codon:yes gene_type:complete
LHGPASDENLLADAAAFGVTIADEVLRPVECEVLQCNWPAVEIFVRASTQWRTSMNGVYGLDYLALEWLFRLYSVEDPADVLEGIQVMEAEVVKRMNAKD